MEKFNLGGQSNLRVCICPFKTNLVATMNVSLTIDGWSSRRLLSMLSLVFNFVDVNGTLRSELLTISYLREDTQQSESQNS